MKSVIIAGSRTFDDYDKLKEICDLIIILTDTEEIVSGGAKGADALGEKYAKETGYPVKRFLADWDQYGKGAGHIRNAQMAMFGDALIAFWDGKSKGTANMIKLAESQPIEVYVYNTLECSLRTFQPYPDK
jgi:hypothetical protein